MNFRTKIEIAKQELRIDHQTQMMLFGSCFSQNIGNKLEENKFHIKANPFGILYNPLSISTNIRRLLNNDNFEERDIVNHNGIFQSFMHHGEFSNPNKVVCLDNIQNSFEYASSFLFNTNVILFTFGTAYVYKIKDTDKVVANCHKFPSNIFVRERLTVDKITDDWSELIDDILHINPNVKLIFTVSPVRHWKDGAHENNISKSILHLAIDNLKLKFPNHVIYFPAYEIVIDELRDYRFYANDMMHPSPIAIEYIWETFGETFFTNKTKEINNKWSRINQSIEHRPINLNTESYIAFLKQTLTRLFDFNNNFPYIDVDKEITNLTERIKQWNTQ